MNLQEMIRCVLGGRIKKGQRADRRNFKESLAETVQNAEDNEEG